MAPLVVTCNVAGNRPVLLLSGPPGVGKTWPLAARRPLGSREPHAIDIGMRGAEEVTELPAGPTWEPARLPSDGPPTFNGSQAAGEPERTGARAPSAPS